MPPSGFNQAAVAGITTLLQQCFVDLKKEVADGKHENLTAAIACEIGNIKGVLSNPDETNQVEQGVLLLVASCYKMAQDNIFAGNNPGSSIEQAITTTVATVATMHINANGKLVKR